MKNEKGKRICSKCKSTMIENMKKLGPLMCLSCMKEVQNHA